MRTCVTVVMSLALLLSQNLAGSIHAATSGPDQSPAAYRWLVSASALVRLQPDVPPDLFRAEFDTPQTIVIVGKTMPSFLQGWDAALAISFTSYDAMRASLSSQPLDPRIRAIVFDDEHWPLTPPAEQRNPGAYTELAATLAHQFHLTLIATPATDLAAVTQPNAASKYQAFLDLHIAQQVARYADVYEIQAQGSEADLGLYRRFVKGASQQARQANPNVELLAGLSTNPTGHHVTASMLYRAVRATSHLVAGYWLNIPGQSPACPSCGTPRPEVAARFLSLLSRSSSPAAN